MPDPATARRKNGLAWPLAVDAREISGLSRFTAVEPAVLGISAAACLVERSLELIRASLLAIRPPGHAELLDHAYDVTPQRGPGGGPNAAALTPRVGMRSDRRRVRPTGVFFLSCIIHPGLKEVVRGCRAEHPPPLPA
jgi:hypothetical protein